MRSGSTWTCVSPFDGRSVGGKHNGGRGPSTLSGVDRTRFSECSSSCVRLANCLSRSRKTPEPFCGSNTDGCLATKKQQSTRTRLARPNSGCHAARLISTIGSRRLTRAGRARRRAFSPARLVEGAFLGSESLWFRLGAAHPPKKNLSHFEISSYKTRGIDRISEFLSTGWAPQFLFYFSADQ